MAESKIRAELKRLANSPFVGNISKQVAVYEQRVKQLVNEFDSRSQTARARSRAHLDKFASQLKRTRGDVEKRISTLWSHEGVRLNKSVNELVGYLKTMTKGEKPVAKVAGSGARKRSTKSGAPRKTTKTKRTGTATKSVSATQA